MWILYPAEAVVNNSKQRPLYDLQARSSSFIQVQKVLTAGFRLLG